MSSPNVHPTDLDTSSVPALGRSLVTGVLLWVLFSIVATAVRGVVWDESHEFAQILLGHVVYPPGHPTYLHVSNMFCLQNYLTAALMWVDPNPVLACGYRNVLYLLAKTVPFFLFGALLTRSRSMGHVTALFALLGAQGFWRAYPTLAWPIIASNGTVGLGFSLLALYFFAANRPLTAYLLAAAMPAVHIGQFPPIFAVACVHLLDLVARKRWDLVGKALLGGGIGLAITGACVAVYLWTRGEPPESGPYHADVPYLDVWRAFMVSFNFHRTLAFGEDQIAMVWMVMLSSAAVLLEHLQGRRGAWFWLALYGWVISLTVWSVMLLHYLLAERMPPILINWMPYRLTNHLVPLLVPMMFALILRAGSTRAWRLLPVLAVAAAGLGMNPNHVYLILCGVTTHAVFLLLRPHRKLAVAWAVLAATGIVALRAGFGEYAWYWLGGVLLPVAVSVPSKTRWRLPRALSLRPARVAVVVCILVAGGTVFHEWRHSVADAVERLPRNRFENEVNAYLEARGLHNDAMIIVPIQLWYLQQRLARPMIDDGASISWIPYNKDVAPALWSVFHDVYDLDLTDTSTGPGCWFGHYQEVWEKREVEDWQRLASRYDSYYVIASRYAKLKLPVAVKGDLLTLYEIPRTTPQTP
jgi:hypothetical protein